ncbi:MAG TPA: ATP-binding protein [Aggregatilineaceae bacterium]|nr:ATP-binding protein [Aggregatilineaceae bacterium]
MRYRNLTHSLRLSFIYMAATALWIIFSDRVIAGITDDRELINTLQTFKGLFFISVMTLLLYVLLRHELDLQSRMLSTLQASEAKWRSLVENAPDTILTVDRQGYIQFSNYPQFNLDVDQLLNSNIYDLILPEHHSTMQQAIQAAFETGASSSYEAKIYGTANDPIWYAIRLGPIRQNEGVSSAVLIARNITERQQMEQAEREQRILAEALADAAATLATSLNPDEVLDRILDNVDRVITFDIANIMLVEDNHARIVRQRGYAERGLGEWISQVQFELNTIPNLLNMVQTGQPTIISDTSTDTAWIVYPDTPWLKSYAGVPIQGHSKVIGFLNVGCAKGGIYTDVHAARLQFFASQAAIAIENAQLYEQIRHHADDLEKRVQERTAQLNHAKERIEAILNSSDDLIMLCRPDGTIEQINPAVNHFWGRTPAEFLNRQLGEVVEALYVNTITKTLQAAVEAKQQQQTEITIEIELQEAIEADLVVSPIFEPDGQLIGVVCSLHDITTHKQMEVQLRQMLQHQVELNELKSRYVSMAAHDLRNPLAVIQSSVGIIQRYSQKMDEEKKQEQFSRINHNIRNIVELLDGILFIAKGETGKFKFAPELLDLPTFYRTIIDEFHQTLNDPDRIKLSFQNDCRQVWLDPLLLRQIVGNLVSNAIKYSNAPIKIAVICEEKKVTFTVQDQGIGIPETKQSRLFDAFYRAPNVGDIPGTGLGMTIVKQSVDLHKGTIIWESEEGIGTTFTVMLPISGEEAEYQN